MAKNVIANCQRCINMFPERNDAADESPVPVTHYLTPGLRQLAQGVVAPVRGTYTASNQQLFVVIGTTVYYVDDRFQLTALGQMLVYKATPVGMKDNGQSVVIVDGTNNGYTINLKTHAFAVIVDNTGAFVGSDWVDFLDTYLVFNAIGTPAFYSTLAGQVVFDGTYIGQLTGQPDQLVRVACTHDEIWLLGHKATEVWNNVGAAAFPFARIQGAFVEHGCAAKYSVAAADSALYWLGKDPQGQAIVFKGAKYNANRISTHAIENEIQAYGRIDDAIGYIYQIEGHLFYVLTFPTADRTWVFDDATQLWHQWGQFDQEGNLHRHRSNCFALAYGKLVVGDFANGKLYELTPQVTVEDGIPITRVRSFPHTVKDGKRIHYKYFIADIAVGTAAPHKDGQGISQPPMISLRWSDTRGVTWQNPVMRSIGATGQFATQPIWRRLGQSRDRVFELSFAIAGATALNGAWIDPLELAS